MKCFILEASRSLWPLSEYKAKRNNWSCMGMGTVCENWFSISCRAAWSCGDESPSFAQPAEEAILYAIKDISPPLITIAGNCLVKIKSALILKCRWVLKQKKAFDLPCGCKKSQPCLKEISNSGLNQFLQWVNCFSEHVWHFLRIRGSVFKHWFTAHGRF